MKSFGLRLTFYVLCAASAFVATALSGCSRSHEADRPAPSSYLSLDEALEKAADIGLSYSRVNPTGSMLPLFGSNAVLIYEEVDPEDIQPGDIFTFRRDDGKLVVHRARENNGRAILTSGDSTKWSDGWITYDRVDKRVVGILYARR